MRIRFPSRPGRAIVLMLGLLALSAGPAQAAFDLGLQDPGVGAAPGSAGAQVVATAMHRLDASVVRVGVDWSSVAPNTSTVPNGFDPSNPADPHYDWSAIDAAVRSAARLHARVILDLFRAPKWAEGPNHPADTQPLTIYPGAWDPSPSAFAEFAHAAAVRYSGTYPDPLNTGSTLPRVSNWEIWNEENLPLYLAAPDLVAEYRALLNAAYGAIKAVDADNMIVMGGLAPVSYAPPYSMAPLAFAADLFCLHRVGTRFLANRACPQRAEFDVFAIHPYSLAATPTKHAYAYDNVLMGDMGKVAGLVAAVNRLHTAVPRINHQIWVTEFAWFTNPPDQLVGDSNPVAARYVAYSLYEMWRSGTDLVIWQTVRDTAGADPSGGGLYTAAGVPKRMLSAYAFPFVASFAHGAISAWGRVPSSGRTKILIQRLASRRWRTVATARTASDGVFQAHFRSHGNGTYRARAARGPISLAYNSQPIPPRRTHLFNSG